jgi:hypothetical protein
MCPVGLALSTSGLHGRSTGQWQSTGRPEQSDPTVGPGDHGYHRWVTNETGQDSFRAMGWTAATPAASARSMCAAPTCCSGPRTGLGWTRSCTELGVVPRDLQVTLAESVRWLFEQGHISRRQPASQPVALARNLAASPSSRRSAGSAAAFFIESVVVSDGPAVPIAKQPARQSGASCERQPPERGRMVTRSDHPGDGGDGHQDDQPPEGRRHRPGRPQPGTGHCGRSAGVFGWRAHPGAPPRP